jgi:hypothetical protein
MGKTGMFAENSALESLRHKQIPHGLACWFKTRPPHQWNDTHGENWHVWRKFCSGITLSQANSTWIGLLVQTQASASVE